MVQYVGGVFTWKNLPRAWEWVKSVSKETVHSLAALRVRVIFERLTKQKRASEMAESVCAKEEKNHCCAYWGPLS